MAGSAPDVGRAVARAGLAGNPSDALGGAALAIPIESLAAEVSLLDAERISVTGPRAERSWSSMDELDQGVARVGHEGGDRLVTAALVTLWRWAGDRRPEHPEPFEARWSTTIPRSVGLAGSSAVIVATMRAAARRWGLEVEPAVLAGLALATERTELGLPAGWMDRAVQAHDAATLVDTRSTRTAGGIEVPRMEVVVPAPIQLVVAWDAAGAAPSGRLHGSLQERFAAGDPAMRRAVADLVRQAELAAVALAAGDRSALADATSTSCGLRRELGALDDRTSALVDIARGVGASATSAGSGGAVTVVPGSDGIEPVIQAYARSGLPTVVVALG